MVKYIEYVDGSGKSMTLEFPDEMDQAAITNVLETDPPSFPKETFTPQGFWGNLAGSLSETVGTQNPKAIGIALQDMGLEQLGTALQQAAEERSFYKPATHSVSQIDSMDSLLNFMGYGLGQAIGSSLPSIVGGGLGAAAGTAIAGPVGTIPGGIIGALTTSFPLNYGDVAEELRQNNINSGAIATLAAIPITALDTLSAAKIAKPLTSALRQSLNQTITETVEQQIKKGAMREGLEGAGSEAITESLQEAIQAATVAWAADKDLFTTENGIRLLDAAVIGAMGGGVLSAASNAASNLIKTPEAGPADSSGGYTINTESPFTGAATLPDGTPIDITTVLTKDGTDYAYYTTKSSETGEVIQQISPLSEISFPRGVSSSDHIAGLDTEPQVLPQFKEQEKAPKELTPAEQAFKFPELLTSKEDILNPAKFSEVSEDSIAGVGGEINSLPLEDTIVHEVQGQREPGFPALPSFTSAEYQRDAEFMGRVAENVTDPKTVGALEALQEIPQFLRRSTIEEAWNQWRRAISQPNSSDTITFNESTRDPNLIRLAELERHLGPKGSQSANMYRLFKSKNRTKSMSNIDALRTEYNSLLKQAGLDPHINWDVTPRGSILLAKRQAAEAKKANTSAAPSANKPSAAPLSVDTTQDALKNRHLELAATEQPEADAWAPTSKHTFSPSISAVTSNLVSQLAKKFGITGNIVVLTQADAQANPAAYGLFSGERIHLEAKGTRGLHTSRRNSRGELTHFITIDESAIGNNGTLRQETVAHEIGHALAIELWNSTAPPTQHAVMRDFQKWFDKHVSMKAANYIRSFLSSEMAKSTYTSTPDAAITELSERIYWTSADEWFANQVAKYVLNDLRNVPTPRNQLSALTHHFFTTLARHLSNLFKTLTNRPLYEANRPTAYMKQFLDSIRINESMQTSGAVPMTAQAAHNAGLTVSPLMPAAAFKQWFRNSILRDRSGSPRPVAHVTIDDAAWQSSNWVFKRNPVDIAIHVGTAEAANERFYNQYGDLQIKPDFTISNSEAIAKLKALKLVGREDTIRNMLVAALSRRDASNLRVEMTYIEGKLVDPSLTKTQTRPDYDMLWRLMDKIDVPTQFEDNIQPFNLSVYARLENPARVPDLGTWMPNELVAYLTRGGITDSTLVDQSETTEMGGHTLTKIYTPDQGNRLLRDYGTKYTHEELLTKIISDLKRAGYDGIIYRNNIEHAGQPADSWGVFDPSQIKSTFNPGTFSLTNNSIAASRTYTNSPTPPNVGPGYAAVNNAAPVTPALSSSASAAIAPRATSYSDIGRLRRFTKTSYDFAKSSKLWAPVWNALQNLREFRSFLVNHITNNYTKNMVATYRDPATRTAFLKAIEISQKPGLRARYTPQPDGSIIFVNDATPGGAKDSTLRPNEIVVLRDKAAAAWIETQEANRWLMRENIFNPYLAKQSGTINALFSFIQANPPPTMQRNQDGTWSNTYNYRTVADAYATLKTWATTHANANTYAALNKPHGLMTRVEQLLQTWGKFNGLMSVDYFPLSRHGTHYIRVLDSANRVVHYEMIDLSGRPDLLKQSKASKRIAALQARYPGHTVDPIAQPVSKDYMIAMADGSSSFSDWDVVFSMLGSYGGKYADLSKDAASIIDRLTDTNLTKPWEKLLERRYVSGFENDFLASYYSNIQGLSAMASRAQYLIPARTLLTQNSIAAQPGERQFMNNAFEYAISPDERFQWMRSLQYYWYLGANWSSGIIQMASLPSVAGPWLTQFTSIPKATATLTKSFTQAGRLLSFRKTNTNYNDILLKLSPADLTRIGYTPDEIKAIQYGIERGIIKMHSALEESGMAQPNAVLGDRWNRLSNFLALPFSTFETLVRLTTYVAAYRLAKSNPTATLRAANSVFANDELWQLSPPTLETLPLSLAERSVNDVMGIFGANNKAAYMRGLGGVLAQFTSYTHQALELWFRMITGRNGAAGVKAGALMTLALMLMGGLRGFPGGDDIEELVSWIMNHFNGVKPNLTYSLRKMASDNNWSDGTAAILEHGLFNALGFDVGRRITLGRIPGSDILMTSLGIRDAESNLGVPGSLIVSNAKGIYNALTRGSPEGAIRYALPTFMRNLYDAAYYLPSKGYVTKRGTQLLTPDDISIPDRLSKAIGFTTTNISAAIQDEYMQQQLDKSADLIRNRFNSQYINYQTTFLRSLASGNTPASDAAQSKISDLITDYLNHNATAAPHQRFTMDLDRLNKEVFMSLHPELRKALAHKKATRATVAELNR